MRALGTSQREQAAHSLTKDTAPPMPSHLRLERAKIILERRLFLKALSLGLAAPVALKLARSATAAPTGAPKRMFLMFLPHGIAQAMRNTG